ncbi:MAG: hypothetical protein H6509_14370 [Bryobacterales bacterium]|nr:hypothetical protein [Acidobacteriota bacterium]MCB9385796.1 hypothetical protein [Bryobacterales bacterium]
MSYFNYFTEVEQHFQQARGSGLFLLSPLDWALLESWKDSGVPLEAALKGIDRAFEKYHKRKRKFRQVNSVAYCTQEVLEAAREMAEGDTRAGEPEAGRDAGFEPDRIAAYLAENAGLVRQSAAKLAPAQAETLTSTAASLDQLAEAARAGDMDDLEAVEQRLSVMEERVLTAVMQGLSEDDLLAIRQDMDAHLAPYRSKMQAPQLAMLERQYQQRAALEKAALPRLSLYYLR